MNTKIIFLSCLLWAVLSSTFAQPVLQTHTWQIWDVAKEIFPPIQKEILGRKAQRETQIEAITISEVRNAKDTLGSGNPFNADISTTDNTIACSLVDTTEFVVAGRNATLTFLSYSPNVVTKGFIALKDFSSNHNSGLQYARQDPQLYYDSKADRYILVFIYNEINTSTGEIVDNIFYVYASTTNDPLNGSWYEIAINHTDVGDGTNWMDRPQIGISDEELFIATNVYDINNAYQDNYILALKKSDLYSGIKNMTVVDIIGNLPPDDLFGMVPVSYGQKMNFGPGMYFIHSDNVGTLSDSVWYYRFPTNVYGNPNLSIYKWGVALNNYEIGRNLPQPNTTDSLDVADCRILSAFYLNGKIHYTFNVRGTSNLCEVMYCRLKVNSGQNTEMRYSTYPSAYGSVASLAFDSTDHTAVIPYLTSDSGTYPSFRVVANDNSGAWSNDILLQQGAIEELTNRWGDYIGAARFHEGLLPTCWVYGSYASANQAKATDSYIAEIVLTSSVGVNPPILTQRKPIVVFPNPAQTEIFIELKQSEVVELKIIDLTGRTIKNYGLQNLQKEIATPISLKGIAKGEYILIVRNTTNTFIGYEKVIID